MRRGCGIPGTRGAWDVHVRGELLYLACHAAGIRILDISDRESPRVIAEFDDEDNGEAQGVWCDGEYVYVADNYGIEVLDIRESDSPREIGQYSGLSGAHDLYVAGGFIYVAEARKGLIIFTLTREATP